MNRAKRKLRGRSGMTLVETLMAVLIITLLTSVIFIGSQAAVRVTVQDTFAAESQSVADTINKALSDVLRYSENITTDAAGKVTYTNNNYGITGGSLRVGTGTENAGHIYLKEPGADGSGGIVLLSNLSYSGLWVVPDEADYASDHDMSRFDLRYSGGVFQGSYRLYDPVHHLLSNSYLFSFRAVNG